MTQTVHVDLGPRAYDIHVERGLLAQTGPETARVLSGKTDGRLALIVSNPKIAAQYGATVTESLQATGFRVETINLPPGETGKTLRGIQRLYQALYAQSADRHTVVIALGGGVVGDMTGFAAATYARGLPLVQIPTTLLAQVDSSVGGKTGVNFQSGKNLIGSFYQPSLVLIDPETLCSLPRRECRSGLAEVIKYGIIDDRAFFATLTREVNDLLDLSSPALEAVIARSCAIKARVVEQDEHEGGLRAILNFGHTVGHALEALTHYRTYRHGEAIALGMVSACLIGEEVGVTRPADTATVLDLLRAAGFETRLPARFALDELLRLLAWDKKSVGGAARFVLMEEIGRVSLGHVVPEVVIRRGLERQQAL